MNPNKNSVLARTQVDGERFVLCRPLGGLNDTLCQIEICLRYAEKTNRTLLVDPGDDNFRREVLRRFEFASQSIRLEIVGSERLAELDRHSAFPREITGRVSSYIAIASSDRNPNARFDSTSGAELAFDVDLDYDEAVLVHHRSGGGNQSHRALGRINLTAAARREVARLIEKLPETYEAVHLRSSDYGSDLEGFWKLFSRYARGQNVLVCSDNPNVLVMARKSLRNAHFFSLGRIVTPDYSVGLHSAINNQDPEISSKNALLLIAELVAVAHAERLFTTFLNRTEPKQNLRISGLSSLMAHSIRNVEHLALFGGLRTEVSGLSPPNRLVVVAPLQTLALQAAQERAYRMRKKLKKLLRALNFAR